MIRAQDYIREALEKSMTVMLTIATEMDVLKFVWIIPIIWKSFNKNEPISSRKVHCEPGWAADFLLPEWMQFKVNNLPCTGRRRRRLR